MNDVEDLSEKQKLISILNALKLPETQWILSGSGVMILHDLPRSKPIGDVDIFVTTALWFALYESTSLTWGLFVPDPEDNKRKNDPPYLFVEFIGIEVNVFHSWRKRSIGDIDVNFWMNNPETVAGYPCIPLQFLLDWKRETGRAKDVADIQVIEAHLGDSAL